MALHSQKSDQDGPEPLEQQSQQFLQAALQHLADHSGDRDAFFAFLTERQEELNETLLQVLENKLSPNPQSIHQSTSENAWGFWHFGYWLERFPLGIRWINLELAIAAYQIALQSYSQQQSPQNWAALQNNLAIAYRNRIRGDRADNLELAIQTYQLALQVRTREAFPQDWAMTQMNLAGAYYDRIRGNRAENLELAIQTYQLALQVHTREAFPQKWAMTQMNLAGAYYDRIRGDRAENLELAIQTYQLALQVRTREAFPQKWAMTQGNLARAFYDRSRLNHDPKDLDQAISLVQTALEVATPGSYYFISHQYFLGNALAHRYEERQIPNDLEQAIQAYRIAYQFLSPQHYDRHDFWQAIPQTQAILGNRLVKDGRWQEGLQLLLNSLEQLSQEGDPQAHAHALLQTGQAYELLTDWDNARLYYRDALRLFEHLKDPPGIAKSRAGLGGVLVSQGHLEKGMMELSAARDIYNQLNQTDDVTAVDQVYQAAQRVLQQQSEVLL
ncbi:tetratricopeptide repeat protein [Acaryochloris sp. IP29b_bin.137]|uniref:tetratricopeptide repeat protein n=1 Tax=Acaryochloris sp. IP29b_bin.137 TaxID=2969217 RepID=UPI002610274A|nr:tetratricopeptide repeat protein [Acaryochloris sp. IP29b_bin.137]